MILVGFGVKIPYMYVHGYTSHIVMVADLVYTVYVEWAVVIS